MSDPTVVATEERSAVEADFLQGADIDLEVLQPQEPLEIVAYDFVAREFARHAGAAMPIEVDWPADEEGFLVRLDGKRYKPHEGQQRFHDDDAVVKAIIGGRGSGKSAGGIQEVQRKIKAGEPGLILAPTEKHFYRSTWVQLNEWLPIDPNVTGVPTTPLVEHWSKTDQMIRFTTGSIVQYGGIYDPDDWRGPNVNWVWLDEPGRIKRETAFLILLGTLRVGSDPRMMLTTTPRGVRHWLYKYFVQREIDDEVIEALEEAGMPSDPEQLFSWHRVTTEQNKHNLAPIFYATLKMAYRGVWAEQELEGKFVSFEGLVFPEYDPKVHLIEQRELPHDWPRYWSIDFGFENPFVAQLWARSPDDRWYREREIYMSGRTVNQHAEKMKEINEDLFGDPLAIKKCVCDTDAEDQATLREHGFKTISAKKDVKAGLQAVTEHLSLDETEKPRLYLMRGALVEVDRRRSARELPTCTEEEIVEYVWPDKGESGELKREHPVKEHDHGMDAMRYLLFTRNDLTKESRIRWA